MTLIDKQILQLISIIWHSSFYLFYLLTSYKLYKPKRTRMQWQLHQPQSQWWGPDSTHQMYLHHYVKKNYEKSLLASFVHLHEIIRRYFTHGFTSDPNLLSPDSRSSFFESKFDLQNTWWYSILHRSFYTLIMYYCDKFYLFILILKVHLSTCFETDISR